MYSVDFVGNFVDLRFFGPLSSNNEISLSIPMSLCISMSKSIYLYISVLTKPPGGDRSGCGGGGGVGLEKKTLEPQK